MTRPLHLSLFDKTERRPLTVSELTAEVQGALQSQFSSVWVEGEICNFKINAGGHWFFSIKDAGAQLRATCFRNTNIRIRYQPRDGLQVRLRGRINVYEARGEYRLWVDSLMLGGDGQRHVALDRLREKLRGEGLFDERRKKALPLLPRRVAIVTSRHGAALKDILHTLERRTRTVHITLVPVRVQGDGAGREIARAFELINEYRNNALRHGRTMGLIDAIIVGRGGGPTEDLWVFNEEGVARAIAASDIPVISAVGHETDVTIADLVADLRAATPTAAAELVAAREDEVNERVRSLGERLVKGAQYRVLKQKARINEAAKPGSFDMVRQRLRDIFRKTEATDRRMRTSVMRSREHAARTIASASRQLSPARLTARLGAARLGLASAVSALDGARSLTLDTAQNHLRMAALSLEAMSPMAVLSRGYAIAQSETGDILRSTSELRNGDTIHVRLALGSLRSRVEQVLEEEPSSI